MGGGLASGGRCEPPFVLLGLCVVCVFFVNLAWRFLEVLEVFRSFWRFREVFGGLWKVFGCF